MPRQSSKRRNFWLPLIFFALLVVGVLIGFQLNKYIGAKRSITTVIERNDRLEELINLIKDRYVDSVSADSLYQDAVSGILNHLDPYTTYIPANQVAITQASLKGKFKGIGIELLDIDDTFMVAKVIQNSPAEKSGLRIGDRVLSVNTIKLFPESSDIKSVRKLLSGEGVTTVSFTVLHPETRQPDTIKVTRGMVPLYSVEAGYMMDSITGYIRIGRFSAMTYREFKKTFQKLQEKGLKRLVLDLRDNPGGYINAATAVAGEFIGQKRLLVYTEGRTVKRENYRADDKGIFEKGSLVVLVNSGTASAAEILTGAVQDWDRAVVIGTRTFGKGLVQQQFELGDGAILRLTIARYFTPSGRCIQKPYRSESKNYLNHLYRSGTYPPVEKNDHVIKKDSFRKKYFSKINHRVLFGGGGIIPDIVIPADPPYSEKAMMAVASDRWLKTAALRYYVQHYQSLKAYDNLQEFEKKFKLPVVSLSAFKLQRSLVYPKAVYQLWQNPMAIDYIRNRFKAQLVLLLFGENDYYRYLNRKDEDVIRARKVLQGNRYSKIIKGKTA